ncbi:MAG TPA: undecaprenyl-diphosphate phosphatase [Candidatus Aphodoplasma excrementigallinarum]|uniref:Undecaprenyl-diphosphatase n=1 Tax=Candidatus Aphodoplasma excrementigallinarum TaxID=2840673 RepID=A0A9D1NGS2_9FIRM|nr:undecaprenyl-diphosphate phosphatase [Candidatus Aphodoplasma excrementigallinarum]
MSVWEALIMGLVQGLTEFLPVSSSGHLVIFGEILNLQIEDGNAFSVLLHVATFLSVCFIYYKDIIELIKEFFLMIGDIFRGKGDWNRPYRRMLIMLIIATVPAVVVGLIFKVFGIDAMLSNLLVVGLMLLVTAVLMYFVDHCNTNRYDASNATYKSSLAVGLAQACALMPGLSRSGSTITAARAAGYKKEFAIKFSFLMSLPAILGAAVLEGAGLVMDGGFAIDALPLVVGFIAAAVSGILAIKFLINLLNKNRFYVFSIYCSIVGLICIIFSIIR